MVARTRINVTLYVHFLCCLEYEVKIPLNKSLTTVVADIFFDVWFSHHSGWTSFSSWLFYVITVTLSH